jgi:hypothetical protein
MVYIQSDCIPWHIPTRMDAPAACSKSVQLGMHLIGRNRTIQERIISMIHHSGLTNSFSVDALLTIIHIINMAPSRPLQLKIRPQVLWIRRKRDNEKVRIFGCEAYALVPKDSLRFRAFNLVISYGNSCVSHLVI